MSNLFVVFTPFQFFVAQQLVAQEQLKDCVLIESYVKGNPHFIDIYNMMEIEGMWKKKIIFAEFPNWDGFRTSSLKDIIESYRNYKKICKIVSENDVDALYLGEMQNTTIRFTAILFSHKGLKIVFFEEGSAHYVERPHKRETFSLKCKAFIRDLLYYLPIYHIRFAKWRYVPNRPVSDGLPITKRFSIIPYYKESFDYPLKTTILFSDKLKNYMMKQVDPKDEKRILFMTDPVAELIGNENMDCYYETISENLASFDKDTKVYLKYHPRDPKSSREKVENIISEMHLQYSVLAEEINIPVEYYLQKYKFDNIYIFNASTYFYDGYIFPKCNYTKLLPILYKKCIDKGIKDEEMLFLVNLLKRM